MKQANGVILATVLATAAVAHAQPTPDTPPAGAGGDHPVSPEPDAHRAPDPAPSPDGKVDPPVDRYTAPAGPAGPTGPTGRAGPMGSERPPIDFPEVLRIPTGWLLPAAALYSTTSVDTGGGVASDYRVGLGDVAEFGVATTDQVRARDLATDKPERIQPYIVASFRLGVAEHRLFDAQPGVTLGFRKSFERTHSGEKSRIAELTLVASKHLGTRAALHLGGAIWDASLQATEAAPGEDAAPEVTLHGHGYGHQLRVFGGFEAQPLPRSSILVDIGWAPEFCYQCTEPTEKIKLRPELSWGVRYQVARFLHIESGVRVPDIGNFNLLDAQIFGQITLTSYALRTAVDRLK